ncbi:MAG TPA: tetratricopeptide repeat protein [Burkholderiales bacterium]|nr:tetratricopeptide repeat protein [Burkholderiales bacterium]
MQGYSIREVQQILGLSRAVISGLVQAGFVAPTLGKHREYRFSFPDLVVMRAAQELASAKISPRRISRSLKRLRSQLPDALPLAGLRITAVSDRVVVSQGSCRWQAETGQYLLSLEVSEDSGSIRFITPGESAPIANGGDWFARGCELEEIDPPQALHAYRRAIELDPRHAGAHINLGRLLHQSGRLEEAEAVYRSGVEKCGEEALLFFNFGVLLEDMRRIERAMKTYQAALRIDPGLADCHYNLGLLYERMGRGRDALRHLNAYRKLQNSH